MDRRHSSRRFWRNRNRLQEAAAKVSFANTLEMLEARQLLAADVVMSEIMFHPSSGDDGQEYIELYNKGDAAANLTGWSFDKGITYNFSGGSLNPGGYLVVAADLAKFQAKYPGVANVVGGWTGTLSNSGEDVELIDNLGATVDQVTYADDGNWGQRERGRGVDLVGSITASGTTATVDMFDHGYVNGDTVQIFGANESEYNGTFVISNVTNSSFEYTMASAPASSTASGNILSRHLIDHTVSGWSWVSFADGLGKSLELINPALGNNDGQNWAASNTLQGTPGSANSVASANVAPLITNVTQTPLVPKSGEAVNISAQLKDETPGSITANIRWRVDSAAGGAFNTAAMHDDGLNGDALAGDGIWTGTIPGQVNGTLIEYYISAGDGVNSRTYSAQALIPSVESLVRAGNVVTATTTLNHGILPGDTITISGASSGFNGTFVVASVPDAKSFTYNQTGSNATAANNGTLYAQSANRLYQVDNTVYAGGQMLFKLIMRAAERTSLANWQAARPAADSNAAVNATLIASGPDGMEGRFNVEVRNRGGGSRVATVSNYKINLLNDHPWNGTTSLNFNGTFSMEDVAGSAVLRAAGLPVQNVVPVQLRVNNSNLATTGNDMFGSYSWLESEDSDMVHNHFPLDDNGNYYRAVDPGHGATLAYLGTDPSSYVNLYHLQTNKDNPTYTDIINLTKAFNATQTPDPNFVAAMNANINVQEWMRYFAASILIGDQETTLSSGIGDDYDLYRGVNDQRFIVIPHDLDTVMGQGSGGQAYDGIFQAANLTSINRLLRSATFAPMYAAAMKELADGAFAPQNIGPLLQNTLGSYVPQANIDAMKTFVANRITAIFSPNSGNPLMPLKLAVTSTPAAVNGYPQVTVNTVDLAGLSNAIKTRSVLVNGVAATWTPSFTGSPSVTTGMGTWSATVANLRPGINRILIQARDENNVEFERMYQDIWYEDGTMTNVSGTLAAGTTNWTAAAGPYHVTASVTVPSGATLNIQAGTSVFFDAGTQLIVNAGGTLIANGTDLARIRFTRTPTAASNWGGIRFVTTTGNNSITYADETFSNGPNIYADGSKLTIDHVTWFDTTAQIVDFHNAMNFRVTNSILPSVVGVEPFHYAGTPGAGAELLIQGNTFGTTTGHNDIIDFTGGNRPGSIFQILDNVFTGTGTGFVNADDILDIDGTDAHIEGNLFMNVYPSPISDTNSAISGGADSGNTSEIVSVRNIFYNVDHAFLMKEGNSVRSVNDTMVHVLTGVYNFDEPGFAASAGVGGYGDGIIMQDVPLDGSGNAIVVQNPGTQPFVLRNSVMPGNTAYTGSNNFVGDSQMIIRNTAAHPGTGVTRNGSIATATVPGHGFIVGDKVLVYSSGAIASQFVGVFTVTNATEDTFNYVVSGTPANFNGAISAIRQPDISEFGLRPGPGPAVGTGPNGVNMGASIPGGATIGGVPLSPTRSTSATITVGGPDIMAYRWKLDNGAFTEVLVTNPLSTNPTIPPINLSGLANGTHTIYVARKNSAGIYQPDAQATQKSWVVNTALPAPTIRINEVLAQNTAAANHSGTFPDMIELYNAGTSSVDLSGMSLTDDPASPRKYVFPAGTPLLASNTYLVVYADNSNPTAGIHTGFSLKQSGEGVYLYNTLANGGTQIDGVTFGYQLEDLSISRQADGSWRLSQPTFGAAPNFPGAANTALPLGDPHQLKINEWGTHGVAPFAQDFIELYNPTTWPIDLGSLSLSDQPIGNPAKSVFPALTFMPAKGYFHAKADGDPQQGADHLNFHLSSERGDIGLYDAAGKQIDFVVYGTQQIGLSQGRTPDGAGTWQFFSPPNPGVSNPAPSQATTTSVPLITITDVWKYNDTKTDLGTTWRDPAYVDGGWTSGGGLLYYEESALPAPKTTQLNIGSTTSPCPSTCTNVTPTMYFRIHFNLAANPADVQQLLLQTVLDDGAIVYLNGFQAFSLGMPNTTINFSTYTGTTNGGRNVGNAVFEGPFPIPMDHLQQGDNVLAVEVHQTAQNSTDIVWGATLNAIVQGAVATPPPLRITEINYHPLGGGASFSPNDYEFIELKNVGASSINLAGVHFGAGVTFNFASGSLAAGATGVLVKNPTAFANRYGSGINILGTYTDSLDDNGEEIRLLAADNSTIQDFAYSDSWYPSTDGDGYTLTIVDPAADVSTWIDPTSWRASKFAFGSPGTTTENATAVDSVVVNEIQINAAPGGDFIELYNPTLLPINIGGWYLTDSAENLLKYRLPATTIQPGTYISFDESQFGAANPIAFTLNQYGADVWLSSSTTAGILTGYHQGVIVGPAESGVTFGRYQTSTGAVDFPPLATPTRNAANSAPKNGPIVFNEVMYHPPTSQGEFIELRNVSGGTVALDNWKFLDGLEFTFPAGTNLGASQLLLLVDQDPNTFRSTYNVPAGVQILQYIGALDNGGENLILGKPGPADQGTGFIPYYQVDRVNYGTTPPWPITPDGQGPSLVRVDPLAYGNDPINWQASTLDGGTPGRSNSGAGDALVDGSAGDDAYYVRRNGNNLEVYLGTGAVGSPAFTFSADSASFTFNGNGGNDKLIVDFTNGAPLNSGAITYAGGAQTTTPGDSLTVIGGSGANNTGSYLPTAGVAGAGTITVGGHVINFSGLEPVLVNTFATFTFTTPASNDSLTLDSPAAGQTRISGNSGGTVFESVAFTNVANFVLDAGFNDGATPNDTITINNGTSATGLSALQIKLGLGSNTINHFGGTSSLDVSTTGAGTSTVNVNNSSTVNFAASQRLTTLNVNGTATARLTSGGDKFLKLSNLTVAATAALDLTNNDMILQANGGNRDTFYSTVSGYLLTGRAGGAWNGKRINSSAAAADTSRNTGLGAILNDIGDDATPIYTTFDGEVVDVNSILVKYSYNGDANLDGTVNADDYAQIDAGFASGAFGYYSGDFNFSGGPPNSDDYFLIDKSYSGQGAPLSTLAPQAPSSTDAVSVADAPDAGTVTAAASGVSTESLVAPSAESDSTKKTRRQRHHRAPDREFAADKKTQDRWVMPSAFSRK